MELRDYIRVVRRNWLLIALATLLGIALSAAYTLVQTPEYTAASKVFVSTSSSQSVADLAQGNNFTVQRVKTYSDLATTPVVLLPVISSLQLETTAERLASKVSVAALADTTIIQITVTDESPVLAAELANAISETLATAVEDLETSENEGANSPVKLTPVQKAGVPSSPANTGAGVNVLLGLLLGMALGVAIAALREALDTRIRNESDVAGITPVPVIGGIAFDPKAKERPLVVHADPRNHRAESFRVLRTNLSFLDVESGRRAFVVTSSVASEGKSTTSANLALSLADSGARVLLVDADLRRPKIADYMQVKGAVGLTDLLIGRAQLQDVAQPWGRSNLYVLPAGKVPPNPSELLGSKAMVGLIQLLDREFDAVIYDAPPLLPVTDAAVLAKSVGSALVVVAAGRTRKNQFTGAMAALANVGARVSGVIMTMLPLSGPDAYGYERYGYEYASVEEEVEAPTKRRSRKTV